jgi:protein-tyrosine phosphatase
MAAGLLEAELDRLAGPHHGFVVESAGLAGVEGCPPNQQAVAAAAQWGVDMRGHRSRQLTPEMARRAERIYCMEPGQVEATRKVNPEARVELLGDGIEDPTGGRAAYDETLGKLRELIIPLAESLVGETRRSAANQR